MMSRFIIASLKIKRFYWKHKFKPNLNVKSSFQVAMTSTNDGDHKYFQRQKIIIKNWLPYNRPKKFYNPNSAINL